MPDISFYILPDGPENARLTFSCKLTEKVYRSGHKIYILADSENQARLLDDQLWTFRAGSFVAHQTYSETNSSEDTPVLIGTQPAPPSHSATLINLSRQIPDPIEHVQHLLEIPGSSAEEKQQARDRYRHYQSLGLVIATHKI